MKCSITSFRSKDDEKKASSNQKQSPNLQNYRQQSQHKIQSKPNSTKAELVEKPL
jgi:hypothetical protein